MCDTEVSEGYSEEGWQGLSSELTHGSGQLGTARPRVSEEKNSIVGSGIRPPMEGVKQALRTASLGEQSPLTRTKQTQRGEIRHPPLQGPRAACAHGAAPAAPVFHPSEAPPVPWPRAHSAGSPPAGPPNKWPVGLENYQHVSKAQEAPRGWKGPCKSLGAGLAACFLPWSGGERTVQSTQEP